MTVESARPGAASAPVAVPAPWRTSLVRWVWLGPLLVTMLVPFLWMVAISLAPGAGESLARALRGPWSLANYRELFSSAGVARYIVNSTFVAIVVVVTNLVVDLAYGWLDPRITYG